MILYLRNKENKTILDVDIWIKKEDGDSFVELSSSINIKNYSLMLLKNIDNEKQLEMISDFETLSNLRGWLWEVFFMTKQNEPEEYDLAVTELKAILKKIADKYDLRVVQD